VRWPEEAITLGWSHRSLVDDELLSHGQVLEGKLTMSDIESTIREGD